MITDQPLSFLINWLKGKDYRVEKYVWAWLVSCVLFIFYVIALIMLCIFVGRFFDSPATLFFIAELFCFIALYGFFYWTIVLVSFFMGRYEMLLAKEIFNPVGLIFVLLTTMSLSGFFAFGHLLGHEGYWIATAHLFILSCIAKVLYLSWTKQLENKKLSKQR